MIANSGQTAGITLVLPADGYELLNRVATENNVNLDALAAALVMTGLTNQADIASAVGALRGDHLSSAADLQREGY